MSASYEDACKALKGLFMRDLTEAVSIYNAHMKERPEWGNGGAIAAVFAAGRVDGIRAERAKKRRRKGRNTEK